MGKIDTQEWGEFRIGDYFTVEYGKYRPKDELGIGNVNYVTSSGINNGISDTYSIADHQGNCITVASDGAMGASFYQEEPFSTSNIVSTLTPLPNIPLNRYIAQFICTVIYNKKSEFGWLGFKMSVDRVRNLIIRLPQTPSGDPDWKYMESYMHNLESKVTAAIDELSVEAEKEDKKIDVREWKEFSLSSIFGQPIRGTRITKANRICGNIPLVTAGNLNEGIAECISNEEQTTFSRGITIDMFGNCFFRDYLFKADDNILIMNRDDIDNKVLIFITACINAVTNNKFSYEKQYRFGSYNETNIILPATTSGTPDWAYMEAYMKKIEAKVSGYIEKIEAV